MQQRLRLLEDSRICQKFLIMKFLFAIRCPNARNNLDQVDPVARERVGKEIVGKVQAAADATLVVDAADAAEEQTIKNLRHLAIALQTQGIDRMQVQDQTRIEMKVAKVAVNDRIADDVGAEDAQLDRSWIWCKNDLHSRQIESLVFWTQQSKNCSLDFAQIAMSKLQRFSLSRLSCCLQN